MWYKASRYASHGMNGQFVTTWARRELLIGWLVILMISAHTVVASAQAPLARGPVLNWVRLSGAEHCIAPGQLAAAVEARLGVAVFVPPDRALIVIEGRVAPLLTSSSHGYSAVLEFTDPDGVSYGTRELKLADADCRKLDPLLTLVIVMTIQRGSGAGGIELPAEIARELDRLFEADSGEGDAVLEQPTPQQNALTPAARPPTAVASLPSPQLPTPWNLALRPSCSTLSAETGLISTAFPPRRLLEVAKAFGPQSVVGSLCADDFGETTGQLIRTIGEQLTAANKR